MNVVFLYTLMLCSLTVSLPATQTQTQSAPNDNCTRAIPITKDLVGPVVVSKAEPKIPKELLAKKHSHSTATVQVVITTEGSIACPKVLKTEDPEFAKVAVEAIMKWKYKPALKNGKPIPVCTKIFMSLSVR